MIREKTNLTNLMRILWAGLLVLTLSACPSIPPPDNQLESLSWPERESWLGDHRHYDARGRISIVTPQAAEQGDFRIENRNDHYLVRISGPFGLGTVTLDGDPQSLKMSSARHGERFISDPETELAEILGFSVPVRAMSYWVLGVSDPAQSSIETLDPEVSRLAALSQGGWTVDYGAYRSFDGIELPRKIDLSGPDVKIRIVFRSWELSTH